MEPFSIVFFPDAVYNKHAGRDTLYTHDIELTFKRYVISSIMRLSRLKCHHLVTFLFSLWIFSRILIMAVSGSVIWGVPSTETPNPKNDRSILADLIKEEMVLLLYSFDSIDCNKSVAGFNSRTIQLLFSLSF